MPIQSVALTMTVCRCSYCLVPVRREHDNKNERWVGFTSRVYCFPKIKKVLPLFSVAKNEKMSCSLVWDNPCSFVAAVVLVERLRSGHLPCQRKGSCGAMRNRLITAVSRGRAARTKRLPMLRARGWIGSITDLIPRRSGFDSRRVHPLFDTKSDIC